MAVDLVAGVDGISDYASDKERGLKQMEGETMPKPPKVIKGIMVGMPAAIYLDLFGFYVYCALGDWPYLVGSVLQTRQFRDVDVRLILADEQYEAMGLGNPSQPAHTSPKLAALTMAFSALGRQITGLPIDFQIQQQTRANELFGGPRSALGVEHYWSIKHYFKLKDKEENEDAVR